MKASDFGLTVTGSSAGQELVKCPFHDDHKASAWFEPNKGLFYCAVCGVGYNAQQLADRLGIDYEEVRWGNEEDEIADYNLLEERVVCMGVSAEGHSYLKQRNISDNVALVYDVRYDVGDKAIVFPVLNSWRHEIGVVKRYLDADAAGTRYRVQGRLTPVWPLYLLTGMESDEPSPIIITEGPFSAMRINTVIQERFDHIIPALALFGAKANEMIVSCLAGIEHSIVFLYDKDEAGIRACRKMRRLMPFAHSFVLPVSPDDMDEVEVLELLVAVNKLCSLEVKA